MIAKEFSLFIDTTNNYCYVAIYDKDIKIDFIKLQVNKNVTDVIVPTIEDLLARNKINNIQIKSIYLNVGPGSFTGCRVGVIIANTWAVTYKLQLYCIDSLTLQMSQMNGISIIDAKTNLKYVAIYDKNELVLPPSIFYTDDLSKYLTKYKDLTIYEDMYESMYDNFLLHRSQFEKLSPGSLAKPLYLKEPL